MADRSSAIAFYNQGVGAVSDGSNPNRLAHAYQLFSSACLADTTWWEAWYQIGNTNSDMNLYPAAIACWRQALLCEMTTHERAKVLCNLGWRLHCLGQTEEAFACSTSAIELDPTVIYAWINLSLIHGIMGNSEQSVHFARQAFQLDQARASSRAFTPDDPSVPADHIDPIVEMALAFSLLFDGQYAKGFRHFEARFRYKLRSFLSFPYPKWEGEPDKTVYLVADQGLGDTLSFSRFVERASKQCRYIHAAVQPELHRLFTHAFLHLPNVNIIPQPCPFPQADCWSTFVSLPSALGLTDEEIRTQPHIQPPNIWTPPNWKAPDRKLHVGIAWAGSPLNEIDKHRNIPFHFMLDLVKVPGVQLYSLQVGPRAQDVLDQGAISIVRHLAPYIHDVVDTLSILKHLDLVITCESALGHVCALAQRECWIPYSWLGRDYRIGLEGKAALWTPKHWVFRQEADMDWAPVFERISDELYAKVERG